MQKNKQIISKILISLLLITQSLIGINLAEAKSVKKVLDKDVFTKMSQVFSNKNQLFKNHSEKSNKLKKPELAKPIKILPSLSSPIVKNNDHLKITVLVKSKQSISTVTAEILELHEKINLKLNSGNLSTGIWTADWVGHDLKEQNYHIHLVVTDQKGNSIEDDSLHFTDPVLGITTLGSPIDVNNNMRRLGVITSSGVGGMAGSAIDTANGFAYFITNSTPASVVKVDLNTFSSSNYSTIDLPSDNGSGVNIVIDPTNRFAYALIGDGTVYKIDVNPANTFQIVGNVSGGSAAGGSMVIDNINNFVYYGSNDANGIVKINVNPGIGQFQVVGAALSLPGRQNFTSAVIDEAAGFAYFGTSQNPTPSNIVKIDLSNFTEAANIALNPADGVMNTAAIDTVHGFAYFEDFGGLIQEVDLSTFTVASTVNSPFGFSKVAVAVPSSGLSGAIYFANDGANVEKLDIATQTFTVTPLSASPTPEQVNYQTAVVDLANGFMYLGRNSATGNILKYDINTDTVVSDYDLTANQAFYQTGIIDVANGYAYFANSNINYHAARYSHGGLTRVKLADFTVDATMSFNAGEDAIASAVLDDSGPVHYGYFGTDTSPGVVIKVNLNTFLEEATIELPCCLGQDHLISAVIDKVNGFAYFAGGTSQYILKVDLNNFLLANTTMLSVGVNLTKAAAIDTAAMVAYFGTDANQVIKIDVNPVNPFIQTVDSPLTFGVGEDNVVAMSLNASGTTGYFVLGGNTGRLIKADLAPFSEVGIFNFNSGDGNFTGMALDENQAKIYLSAHNQNVIKFDLGGFSSYNKLNLFKNENQGEALLFDVNAGNLYLGENNNRGRIVKVAISRKGAINAYKVNLPTLALDLSAFHFYSHFGTGNIRLGLYDSSFNRLWDSGTVANGVSNGWIDVLTNVGTPSTLSNLPAGDYWLAFQVDTTQYGASVSSGSAGDGYYLDNQTFGAFPASISGGVLTNEVYSFYATYSVPPGVNLLQSTGSTDVTEGTLGNFLGNDEIAVSLATQPLDDVTVNAFGDANVNVAPSVLTFTNANWNTVQYLKISAVDDALAQGNHTGTLSFNVVSLGDPAYNALPIPNIIANIKDNDLPLNAYLANDILGQLNQDNTPNFTNNIQDNNLGVTNPIGYNRGLLPTIDTVHHRLFISDNGNARVLEYDLDANNNLLDRIPDHVLGQLDFVSAIQTVTKSGMVAPSGLAYDSSKNLLYVSDQAANRIVVFDVSTIVDGQDAVHVLGQTDFISSGNSLSQGGLFQPTALALDESGQRLFISDLQNSRVVVYDVASITDGELAVNVLGSADFVTPPAFVTNSTNLIFPVGMAFDQVRKLLFVAENLNNRVMIFDVNSISDGEPAVHVLGQPNFITNTPTTTQNGFSHPITLSYDSQREQLFTSEFDILGGGDPQNNRILMFDMSTIVDNQPAVNVLGAADFVTAPPFTTSQNTFSFPILNGLDIINHQFFAGDFASNRALQFKFIRVLTAALPAVVVGTSYSQQITAAQYQGNVAYSLSSGNLPPGLTLSASGLISGQPTNAGTYNFTIFAKDNIGAGYFYDRKSLSISVSDSPAPIGGGGFGGSAKFGQPSSSGGSENINIIGHSNIGGSTNLNSCTRNAQTVLPFTDVVNHWAKDYISELYNRCIIDGKTPTLFDPDASATRAEFAKIALRLFKLGTADYEAVFEDVGNQDWFASYVLQGYKLNILKGYERTALKPLFKPNQSITRAEVLKVILLAKGVKLTDDKANFADVKLSDWYYSFVAFAQKHGIIEGYKGKNGVILFAPNQPITRAEIAKIAILVDRL